MTKWFGMDPGDWFVFTVKQPYHFLLCRAHLKQKLCGRNYQTKTKWLKSICDCHKNLWGWIINKNLSDDESSWNRELRRATKACEMTLQITEKSWGFINWFWTRHVLEWGSRLV